MILWSCSHKWVRVGCNRSTVCCHSARQFPVKSSDFCHLVSFALPPFWTEPPRSLFTDSWLDCFQIVHKTSTQQLCIIEFWFRTQVLFRLDVGRWRFGFFLSWLNAISNYPEEIRNMNTSTDSPFLRGTRKSQLLLFAHIPFMLHLCNCWQHTTEFSKWRNVFNFSNGKWTYYKKNYSPLRLPNRAQQKRTTRSSISFHFGRSCVGDLLCVAMGRWWTTNWMKNILRLWLTLVVFRLRVWVCVTAECSWIFVVSDAKWMNEWGTYSLFRSIGLLKQTAWETYIISLLYAQKF